jgi:hypothetical protein
LELATGELNSVATSAAKKHLEICPSCAAQWKDLQNFREEFSRSSIAHSTKGLYEKFNQTEARRPWKGPLRRLSFTAATVLFFSTVGIWLLTATPLGADLVLAKALNVEEHQSRLPNAVRIRLESNGCSAVWTRAGWLNRASDECELPKKMDGRLWDWDNPLSVQTYQHWRNGLSSKTDSLNIDRQNINLETRTGAGALRFAVLTISRASYAPVQLRLGVNGNDSLTLSPEEVEPPKPITLASLPPPLEPPAGRQKIEPPAARSAKRAADESEVAVLAVLHRLNADEGYEAVVQRDRNQISVIGLAADTQRQDELQQGLRGIPDVRISISTLGSAGSSDFLAHVPARSLDGVRPGLLEQRLREELGSSDNEQRLKNDTLGLSQKILGLTSMREDLRHKRNDLGSCTCATQLAGIDNDYRLDLESSLSLLEKDLAFLLPEGQLSRTRVPTLTEARRLDAALIKLFAGSDASDNTDQQSAMVVRILYR